MKRISWSFAALVAALLLFTSPADAQCTAAIFGDSGSGPNEVAYLTADLIALGCTVEEVASLQEARDVGACTFIDRWGASNPGVSDIDSFLADGYGYVHMGDWPEYFAEEWEQLDDGTPFPVTVVDSTHPLTAGLPASWTGHGFWAYDWEFDALGYATDGTLPNLVEAQATELRERVVTGLEVGPGRAAYIGINTYGPAASAEDRLVLRNAAFWTCGLEVPGGGGSILAIPTLGGVGLALLALGIALAGALILGRRG